jgi:Glycosyl hydrolase family 10
MGTMSFLLPPELSRDAAEELERACVAGGPDNMPWPTHTRVDSGRLILNREVEESGSLVAPWHVNGFGQLMGTSGTLIDRSSPYHFQVELARGKVNQLRCQAADWQLQGMYLPPALKQHILDASLAFGRAVTRTEVTEAGPQAQVALEGGYRSAEEMVLLYIEQMFQARHQRQPRLDTMLGCRLGTAADLQEAQARTLAEACNGICIPFMWQEIEPSQGEYTWDAYDALVSWAQDEKMALSAGPLIDFSTWQLPAWLLEEKRDLSTLAAVACDYVEQVIRRYRGQIRTWQLTNASNCATVLSLTEDELLWLTVRLAEVARQVDPNLGLGVGIAQPWGEYMATEDRTHSPFIFADTLVRSGMNLAHLELELIMGLQPRGSYFRDLLEVSRLIDLYSLLGVPLRVTLGYPSAEGSDPNADPALRVGGGHWRQGFTPAVQAEWASLFAALVLCKPAVRSVLWPHLSDSAPHQFPHCGLFDQRNQAKPVVQSLQRLRENHLR